MQIQMFLAITLVANQCLFADASWANIAGYAPGSKVTSHNAIDLDQKAIENVLAVTPIQYTNVKNIYEQGGNSKTYAEFTVSSLSVALSKSDAVVGATSGATGKMYASYSTGVTTIRVAYITSDVQASYVGCKGGALSAAPSGTTATSMTPYILTTGCFQAGETLTITTSSGSVSVATSGTPTTKAGRTLLGFSTKAEGTMYTTGTNGGCSGASDRATDGCPYRDFTQYYNYYGVYDYANMFVLAAINGGATAFTKAEANMDFTSMADVLRKECIKKGTAYMNAYMYAIREYEDAIDDCKAGCPGGQSDTVTGKDCNSLSTASVHAWDEGVAFYTGSLEGANAGGNSAGKMSYRLAEKRCANYKTCGATGDMTTGTSYVNTEIFKQLDIGKNNLLTGKCEDTRPVVRQIVALMAVPLIQGTLRYAYKLEFLAGGDKERGEGAVFAAAIVPRVAACSAADATIIMNNMKVGASTTSFSAVKAAFENNYACMETTCKNVGGLWFTAQSAYYTGASPCSTQGTASGAVPHHRVRPVAALITVITMIFCCLGQ
jgi:hypothetical protein